MSNELHKPEETIEKLGTARDIGVLEALWRVFSSMKTAIALLLILAVASIFITIVESRHGSTDLYQSSWFVSLLTLIGANLAVCSINRFGIAWRRTFRPRVNSTSKQVAGMQRSETLAVKGAVGEIADKVITALRSRSYYVMRGGTGDDVAFYAAKGRLSVWGPYVTHLSIFVIFLGAILGNRLGFEGFTTIMEGDYTNTYYSRETDEYVPLGFQVHLREFTIELEKGRHVSGYKSDLQVYEGEELVAEKIIDVNSPLTYNGVTFFQSSYGVAGFVLRVTAPNGETERYFFEVAMHHGNGRNHYVLADMSPVLVEVGGMNLGLFAHGFVPDYVGEPAIGGSLMPIKPAALVMVNDRYPEHSDASNWTRLGWLTTLEPTEYEGWTISMDEAIAYTGLQVGRNPALAIIYAGFGLMMLGIIASFYVNHRAMRVLISPSEEGATVHLGVISKSDPSVFDEDLEKLRGALDREA